MKLESELTYAEHAKFRKNDSGKLRYSLVPPKSIADIADILTFGANKYDANNWRLCKEPERYIDALYRHLEAWRAGEKLDPESGRSHLAHALTNLVFINELYID